MRQRVGSILIKNTDDYTNNYSTGQGTVGTFAARTAGTHGNNLLVSTCPSATAYEEISTSDKSINNKRSW